MLLNPWRFAVAGGGAAPTVRSGSSANSAGVTSLNVDTPAGTTAGDVMIAYVQTGDTSAFTATGWTIQSSLIFAGSTTYRLLTKIAGSEGSTQTFSLASAGVMVASIVSVANAAIDVVGPFADASSSIPCVAPSITPTAGGVLLAGYLNGSGAPPVGFSAPAGMSIVTSTVSDYYRQSAIFSETLAGAGATGTRSSNVAPVSSVSGALISLKSP